MKNLLFLPLFLFALCGKPNSAHAQADVIPLVVEGVNHFAKFWSWKKAGWVMRGCPHRPIKVYFEDGTVMYDEPRDYRTPYDILNGHLKYTDYYGKIVDIQMVFGGKWYSVITSRFKTRNSGSNHNSSSSNRKQYSRSFTCEHC
jgi:hypothetical protein